MGDVAKAKDILQPLRQIRRGVDLSQKEIVDHLGEARCCVDAISGPVGPRCIPELVVVIDCLCDGRRCDGSKVDIRVDLSQQGNSRTGVGTSIGEVGGVG